MSEGLQLVGIRKAAELYQAKTGMTLNASTISRYVKNNPELNHAGDGQAPLVDVDELIAHRHDNVNEAMSGNHAGRAYGDGGELPLPPARRAAPSGGTRAAARTAHDAIKARILQLDLEERLKITCSVADAEAAGMEIGALLQEQLTARNPRLAETFATLGDPRDILARLEAEDGKLLKALDDAADRALRGDEGSDET